MFSYSLEDNFS